MAVINEILIPPMAARVFAVAMGQRIGITDIAGGQPGDLIAFNAADFSETFSQSRTRVENRKLWVGTGDELWTNSVPPRKMFAVLESPDVRHDLIYGPCCRWVLRERFGVDRDGCFENLAAALHVQGYTVPVLPDPLNLFFQVDVGMNGSFAIGQHRSKPGACMTIAVLMDCIVAVSTCSVPIEGRANSGYRVQILAG